MVLSSRSLTGKLHTGHTADVIGPVHGSVAEVRHSNQVRVQSERCYKQTIIHLSICPEVKLLHLILRILRVRIASSLAGT